MRRVIFTLVILFASVAQAQEITPPVLPSEPLAVQPAPPLSDPVPPTAQSPALPVQSDEVYDMASTFMACSGLYEVFSVFTRSRGEVELSNSYRELSLAAKTAAAMTASMVTDSYRAWAFADSLGRVQITFWRTVIRTEGLDSLRILRQFEECNRLNNFQEALVRQYRMQAFGLK